MTKIDLDDVLKIMRKYILAFESSRVYYAIQDELKQLANQTPNADDTWKDTKPKDTNNQTRHTEELTGRKKLPIQKFSAPSNESVSTEFGLCAENYSRPIQYRRLTLLEPQIVTKGFLERFYRSQNGH